MNGIHAKRLFHWTKTSDNKRNMLADCTKAQGALDHNIIIEYEYRTDRQKT